MTKLTFCEFPVIWSKKLNKLVDAKKDENKKEIKKIVLKYELENCKNTKNK